MSIFLLITFVIFPILVWIVVWTFGFGIHMGIEMEREEWEGIGKSQYEGLDNKY